MLKHTTHIIAAILILTFVGCSEDSVAPEYNYEPDPTPRSKIEKSRFMYNGLNREYTVFLPKNYQSNMPLVLNLHSANSTMERWMNYTRMNSVADTANFIVVYPSGGQDWRGTSLHNENVGFISALLDTLKNKYKIDMSRVYCTGGSSGGFMTYTLIGKLGHRFAAAASVAASLFDNAANWNITKATPILIISGTEDTSVPYSGDKDRGRWSAEETINYWVQNNKCSLQADTLLLPSNDSTDDGSIEKIIWTNCSNNSSVVFYKVIGGGHHWPGGNIDFITRPEVEKLNNDINSSAEIWNFFKNYSN